MSLTTIFIFGGLVVLILGSVAMLLFEKQAKKKQPKRAVTSNEKPGLISKSKWLEWYRKVDGFFLTRSGLRKIYKQIMQLSVYNSVEAKIKALKIYLSMTALTIVVLIAAAIVFRDVFMFLVIYLFVVVVKNILITKQIDAVHFQILNEMMLALSNLRQTYMRTNSVSDSISETEVHPLLQRAFEDIHLILTSSDSDKLLEEFYATTPFKLLRTLASVCYKLDSTGDTILRDGTSNFTLSLNMLTTEAQMEVRRLTNQKLLFGSLEYMPIMPIFAIPLIEWFFIDTIPGTGVIYGGTVGYISKVTIVVLSIVGYVSISNINSAVPIRKDDRSDFTQSLLRINIFNKIVRDIMPKSMKRIVRTNLMLRGSLSAKDIKHVYADKIIYSTGVLIFSLFVAVFSVVLGKEFQYNNVQETSLIAGEELTAEEVATRQKMDAVYLDMPELPSAEYTQEFLKTYFPNLSALDTQDGVKRLMTKYDSYHNTFLKWWHILLCVIATIAAWWTPDVQLRLRRILARAEAEEDVLQLQTVITILMNTTSDTLETLDWLQRQSDIHKNPLLDCYHEYPSNPEIALQKLKAKVSIVEFKRIIDKLLLTVHQVSLLEAFSDLVVERDHTLRVREMTQDKALKKKRGMAKPLAMLPLYAVVMLYFMVPLGYLGYLEFVDAMANMDI